MATSNVKREYPLTDAHRKHFILFPILKKNNKWVGAEVLLGESGGYIDPEDNPTKVEFTTEAKCKKSCDLHNEYHFGSTDSDKDYVNGIIWESMALSIKTNSE